MQNIQQMDIDLSKTDLLITHLHSDHSGLAAALNKEGVQVYAGKIDGKMINEMAGREYWENYENVEIKDRHAGARFI